jgi:G3E family GTPase
MKIKTEIEIVTGFLGSGKTSFINAILKNTLVKGERVLIIQCEAGEKNINLENFSKNKIIIKEQDPSKALGSAYLKQMINFYNPHRIIIEHNGMRMLGETLGIFNNELEALCMEPTVYHITDALTFDMFITNMKELIEPFIYHSNLIVINNSSVLEGKARKNLVKKVEALNQQAFIIPLSNISELSHSLIKADILQDGIIKSFRIALKNKMSMLPPAPRRLKP